MKVKLKVAMANPNRICKEGDIIDVPDAEAKQLIDGGYAETFPPVLVEAAKSGTTGKRTPPPVRTADAPGAQERAVNADDPNRFARTGPLREGEYGASNEGQDRMGGDKVGAVKQPDTPRSDEPHTAKSK